jgi:ubiquitin-conjugating enzyme E2 O
MNCVSGLILVREPYFNEAGYERQKGTQQGTENSRMYNEMAILKLVQSLTKMAVKPPEFFKAEVRQHFEGHAKK